MVEITQVDFIFNFNTTLFLERQIFLVCWFDTMWNVLMMYTENVISFWNICLMIGNILFASKINRMMFYLIAVYIVLRRLNATFIILKIVIYCWFCFIGALILFVIRTVSNVTSIAPFRFRRTCFKLITETWYWVQYYNICDWLLD